MDYKELFEKYNVLLEEIKRLKKENGHLWAFGGHLVAHIKGGQEKKHLTMQKNIFFLPVKV